MIDQAQHTAERRYEVVVAWPHITQLLNEVGAGPQHLVAVVLASPVEQCPQTQRQECPATPEVVQRLPRLGGEEVLGRHGIRDINGVGAQFLKPRDDAILRRDVHGLAGRGIRCGTTLPAHHRSPIEILPRSHQQLGIRCLEFQGQGL